MVKNNLIETIKNLYSKSRFHNFKKINQLLKKFEKYSVRLSSSLRYSPKNMSNIVGSYLNALLWVNNNSLPSEGIVVTSKQRRTYLEVTGYFIPTLIAAGEHQLL